MPNTWSLATTPIADEDVWSGRPLRAFIYDRNSKMTGKNRVGGRTESTIAQNTENNRFCAARGWPIVAEFEDPGVGASRYSQKKVRPDFEAMMQRLEDGIRPGKRHAECDVLVVWAASRATRDMTVYLRIRDVCERARVLLCYNGTVYNMTKGSDRFVTGLGALQAELEVDNIRDGILRTTRTNAERGRPHGRIPYGYRREYDPNTGALVGQFIDDDKARVVRRIGDWVAAAKTEYWIAKKLNAEGVAAPAGGEWTPEAVGGLIVRPVYAGLRQHQGRVIGKATWPAILDMEVHNACVARLSNPSRRTQRDTAVKHLLSGVAWCGECSEEHGSAFALRPVRTPRKADQWAYVCKRCYGASIQEPVFDTIVTSGFLRYVEREEFRASLLARVAQRDEGAAADAQAAAELEAELAQARKLAGTVVNGRLALSAVSLAAMEGELLPQIEKLRASAQGADISPLVFRLAGGDARRVWDEEFELPQRRSVLRQVVVIRLFSGGRGVRSVTPERYTLDWLL